MKANIAENKEGKIDAKLKNIKGELKKVWAVVKEEVQWQGIKLVQSTIEEEQMRPVKWLNVWVMGIPKSPSPIAQILMSGKREN